MQAYGATISAIAALWAAALFLAAFRLMRGPAAQKVFLLTGVAAILIAVFAFVAGGIQDGREGTERSAILFAPSAPVKSAPDAQSTDLFVLHEGVKFDLLDAVGEWRKIRIADGKVGWLPAADMQVI